MPLKTASLSGSICSCCSAIWIPVRMPKSPQPGHQSLCRSLLYSLSVIGLAGALMDMSHHRFCFRSDVHARERADHLVLAERTTVELVDTVRDHHAGLLLHELRELTDVVFLHGHDPFRRPQDRGDRVRRERLPQPRLEEGH